jgi:hypothetical protein
MARRIMAPKVAIRIDGKLRPVTSGPPKRLTMKPPISPTIMRAKIPKVLPPPLAIALFYATVPDSIAYI